MKEMKTLTIGGTTYEIVDDKAREAVANTNNDNRRASAPPITQMASGSVIAVNNYAERPLNNLKLFGKTTQLTTTGAQLLDFSAMKKSPSDTGASISESGRVVTITGGKPYTMGYIDVDVSSYVGQTLYLTGTVSSKWSDAELMARLIKTDGTETYIATLSSGYTVLADDATISLQFYANYSMAITSTPRSATFTEVMLSTVKDAAWEPYTGGVHSPNPDHPQNLNSVENPIVTIHGGNLIPAVYADGMHTESGGITFDVQPDGSIIVNGTAITTGANFIINSYDNKIEMPNGWLSTSSGVGIGSHSPYLQHEIYVDGQLADTVQNTTESAMRRQFFGKVELGLSRLVIPVGVTVVSQRIYPMLCAFENPIDYEPPKPTQTMTINRTLPAIGDVRDEIDFERGVYIQRIGVANLRDYVDRCIHTTNEAYSSTILRYDFADMFGTVVRSTMFCNRFPYKYAHGDDIADVRATECISTHSQNDVVSLFIDKSRLAEPNANGLSTYLAENDVVIYYVRTIPIETPLTEEELAAFDQLYTYAPVTTVYNDYDAGMEIKYTVDTKTYVDENSGKPSDEQIEAAVNAYLEENPITGGSGQNGADGYSPVATVTQTATGATISITDKNGTTTASVSNGKDGKDGTNGSDGSDGVSPTVSVNKSGKVTTLTITDKNGTKTATINDGVDGKDGTNGNNGTNGVSPTVSVNKSGKVTTITITDATGTKTATINDGTDGKDATSVDGTIPSYWQSHINEKVALIREAMLSVGVNKSAFFFYSDAHWSNDTPYTAKMAPTLLKHLCKNTPINKVNYGGDIVSAEAADAATMAYLWDWRSQLHGLNHHSVPGNHDDGNAINNLFSESYVYGYLLAPEETADIVRGDEGMYYYIDNPVEKTRYLYLDTAYKGVSSEEQAFVKEALISTPDNWHIVAIAHIWYANNYDVYPPVLVGFDTNAKKLLDMFDNYNARAGEFAECLGKVEFCIGGHYHLDHVEHTDGGIPVIIVEADTLHDRSGTMPQKGTTDESAISAVIADYATKTVQIIRVGRGSDYETAIDVSTVKYTNVLSSAILSTGEVLNGTGWAANSRLGSGTLDNYVGNGSNYITGYIAIDSAIDNTIRLRNITFDGSTDGNYSYMFVVYDASFARVGFIYSTDIAKESNGYTAVMDGNNITEFTVKPQHHASLNWSNVKYFAICCTEINDDSIITINQEIE